MVQKRAGNKHNTTTIEFCCAMSMSGEIGSRKRSVDGGEGGGSSKINRLNALNYLDQVKTQFNDRPEIYTQFLEVMKEFKANVITTADVIERVRTLFADYPHLLEGFNAFLPSDQKIPVTPSEKSPVVEPSGGSGSVVPPVQRQYIPPPAAVLPRRDSISVESKSPVLRRDSKQMEVEGNGSKRRASMGMVQAVSYVKKIRERFHDQPEIYQAFVDILKSYQRGETPTKEVYAKVKELFGDNADLLREFGKFVPDGSVLNEEKRMDEKMETEFFERVKKYLKNDEQQYGDFLKTLNWYTQDIIRKEELVDLVRRFIGKNEELFSWFKWFVGYTEPGRKDPRMVVNLGECRRLGSYRFLPESYEEPGCSGKDEMGREVLNTRLVSCPSFSSEESTFESSRKNVYEETLFRCEEERYELDILINGNYLTISNFERVLQREDLGELDEYLGGKSTTIYRNSLRNVYGDRVDEVIARIRQHPKQALPVVIARLKQKDEEWRLIQREWNRTWNDIHHKNYYKALDHQGLNVKSIDKKTTSNRSLVNELHVLGNRGELIEWKIRDIGIVKDLFSLLMDTCGRYYEMSERISMSRFLDNFMTGFVGIGVEEESRRMFYGNEQYCLFFRMFQVLYQRLEKTKEWGLRCKENPLDYQKRHLIATQIDPQHRKSMDFLESCEYYLSMVEMVRLVISGKMDQNMFEENMRMMFGPYGYLVFTIDRMLVGWAKHGVGVLESRPCQNLMALYESYVHPQQGHEFSKDSYRLSARLLMPEEDRDIFRIESWTTDQGIEMRYEYEEKGNRLDEKIGMYVQQFVDVHMDPDQVSGSEDVCHLVREVVCPVKIDKTCQGCRRLFMWDKESKDPTEYPSRCVGDFVMWLNSYFEEYDPDNVAMEVDE